MEPIYPISFTNGVCTRCGSKSLRFVDKNGTITKTLIYPMSKLYCDNCDTYFYTRWIKSELSGRNIPVICSKNSIDEFEKYIIKFAIDNKRKVEVI